MVLARVGNVKSGWKSMFMVFTTAAGDEQPTIVRLAFDTIEKIVREHFDFITETEITTFTDCVNCLIAFTNNPHSIDVSLNAIAFLRFCAMKLAEGAIGEPRTVQSIWKLPSMLMTSCSSQQSWASRLDIRFQLLHALDVLLFASGMALTCQPAMVTETVVSILPSQHSI